MIDHVKTLLLNPDGVPGYRRVADVQADAALALFGVVDGVDPSIVDGLLPLALSPDLRPFRRFFDQRTTPAPEASVYGAKEAAPSHDGLYDRVFGGEGWWVTAALFEHVDPLAASVLREMRAAAESRDAPYAIGAVLIACAYRRLLRQGGGA